MRLLTLQIPMVILLKTIRMMFMDNQILYQQSVIDIILRGENSMMKAGFIITVVDTMTQRLGDSYRETL